MKMIRRKYYRLFMVKMPLNIALHKPVVEMLLFRHKMRMAIGYLLKVLRRIITKRVP
jgi:hypothetical protein